MSPVHLHLLLNHVPIIGLVFAILLLLYGLARRSDEVVRASLGAMAIVALVAIVVYLTGEGAEEAVERLPGVSEAILERHEDAALLATIALGVLGALAAGALVVLRRAIPRAAAAGALLVALVPMALVTWTAWLGGQVRHTEIRPASTASIEAPSAGEPAEHD